MKVVLNRSVGPLLVCWLSLACTWAAPEPLRGRVRAHDPSAILKCKDEYWMFATGWGIASSHSKDLLTWEAGPRVFAQPPAWATNTVPGNAGHFWAPDLIQLHGQYFLYYSVSTWGSRHSAIGLATNPTLDPADASFHWTDQGLVIQSSSNDNFNAIDPSVLLARDGRLWLAFGSFWSGIKLVELDPQSGKRLGTNAPLALAWKKEIEAACLYQHGDYYYLFVNWGLCCRGTNSTYNIRVGRSPIVTGPYLDQAGQNLLQGGGSLFLDADGRYLGPGHAGFLSAGGTNWLSYHFYDAARGGMATLGLRPVRWDQEQWPRLQ